MIQIWKNGARPEFWEDEYAVIPDWAWRDLLSEAREHARREGQPGMMVPELREAMMAARRNQAEFLGLAMFRDQVKRWKLPYFLDLRSGVSAAALARGCA